MDEIIELYFKVAYRIIGRIIYGKAFNRQSKVPLFIKILSGCFAGLIFAAVILLVVKINN